MARLGSPGCHVDVCLLPGGEEAGLVVSTSLPQPTAFEQLRRRENEILKSASQPPNDCCSATRVDSKAARGESDTTQPSPLPITVSALSAQAIHAAEGPGCSTRSRRLPDLAAGATLHTVDDLHLGCGPLRVHSVLGVGLATFTQ